MRLLSTEAQGTCGHVTLPQNIAILGGSPVQAAGSGLTVYVTVYGDQN